MEFCPKCNRKLKSIKQWHNCVNITVESHFENKPPVLLALYTTLADAIRWPDVAVSATQNCIVFVKTKTFLVIRPMKTGLDCKFYLPEFDIEFPVYKCIAYGNKFETSIRLMDMDDLDKTVLSLVKKSYDLS